MLDFIFGVASFCFFARYLCLVARGPSLQVLRAGTMVERFTARMHVAIMRHTSNWIKKSLVAIVQLRKVIPRNSSPDDKPNVLKRGNHRIKLSVAEGGDNTLDVTEHSDLFQFHWEVANMVRSILFWGGV